MRRRSTALVALAVALAGLAVGVVVDLVDDESAAPGSTDACGTDPLVVAVAATDGDRPIVDIVRSDRSRSRATPFGWVAEQPDLSPDGQRLVVARADDQASAGATSLPATTLWTIGLDGGDPRPVTEGGRSDVGEVSDSNPRWSPDGRTIAFTRLDPELGPVLMTVPAEGGEPRPLVATPEAGALVSPAWSPDGARIAYLVGHWGANGPTGEVTLWVVGADGSDPVEAGRVEDHAVTVDWHPARNAVLVGSSTIDDDTLSLFDMDTGRSTVLARGAAGGRWSRGGSHVVHHTRVGVVEGGSWSLVERPFDGTSLGASQDLGVETASRFRPEDVSVAGCAP